MKDDDIAIYIAIASLTFAVVAVVFVVILLRYNKVKMRRQQEILMASFQAQENERTRIAEDLHDDVGPRLSALKLAIELLKQEMTDEQKTDVINDTSGNLDFVIKDIRAIVRNLSSKYIAEKGVYLHLLEMKKQFEQSGKYSIDMQIEDLKKGFNTEFEINLFRVLQELTNNSVKHSGCTEIKIKVNSNDEGLLVTYSDNGKGFEESKINKGLGLNNITTRVKMFRGHVDLFSKPQQGVTYKISFALNDVLKTDAILN